MSARSAMTLVPAVLRMNPGKKELEPGFGRG